MNNGSPSLWGIVLAGGEGERLRGFIKARFHSNAPKQFCTFFGGRSMLEHTLHRAEKLIPRERLLVVILDHHRPYASASLAMHPPDTIVVQPCARGTVPAIALPLLHIMRRDPRAMVVTLPTDHFITPETHFMAAVGEAAECLAATHDDTVVLLGVPPLAPETDYGWIEPGEVAAKTGRFFFHRIARFHEKPPQPLAHRLLARGALWNTFVLVARASTLLRLIRTAIPDADRFVAQLRPAIGTAHEADAIEAVYRTMPTLDFSKTVLGNPPPHSLVLPVRDVWWNDLGRDERVLNTLARFQAPVTDRVGARGPVA